MARRSGVHAVHVLALPHGALRPGSQGEVMVVRRDRLSARPIDFVIARVRLDAVGRDAGAVRL